MSRFGKTFSRLELIDKAVQYQLDASPPPCLHLARAHDADLECVEKMGEAILAKVRIARQSSALLLQSLEIKAAKPKG